jgi:heptosyltransferase-2
VREFGKILVIQTAFIGDVVLTLPLVQVVRRLYPGSLVDVVVTPRSRELLSNHPDIHEVIVFDKRGSDRGIRGLWRLARQLKSRSYDLALIPHRSLRSVMLAWVAGVPVRIGFDRSAGRLFLTATAIYQTKDHEIDRNLSLLNEITSSSVKRELPRLYPADAEKKRVDRLLIELELGRPDRLIAIAPGTVWNTKRWLKERYASLAVNFDDEGFDVVLIGGEEDRGLCAEICTLSGSSHVHSVAGMLSLLQSAELIRRCLLLVCNDSAPTHIAAGVGTPVVALFGATVPAFGFGPSGPFDAVVQTDGLPCRPCSMHGGEKCPIKTFDCMVNISHERVFTSAMEVLRRRSHAEETKS